MTKKKNDKPEAKPFDIFKDFREEQARAEKEHLSEYDTSRSRGLISEYIDDHKGD